LSTGAILVTGAAGLVGQNLMLRLKTSPCGPLIGIDKHPTNTKILACLHPDARVIESDLARPDPWRDAFAGVGTLVLNHAQIGGTVEAEFVSNNITATQNVLAAAKHHSVPYIVHISSSVVNSLARDYYTETKKAQEQLVRDSGIPCCILRPTLMFGWFDRKHLGWLARFMERTPVFPIPGHGRYLRQPLYAGDFSAIVMAAVTTPRPGETFNISGQSKVEYVELIRSLRAAMRVKTPVIRLPYALFWLLLKVYAAFDRNPPFTTKQLEALVTPDVFEVIDWPKIFAVPSTPLRLALQETFQHPQFSKIVLEF
jgi:nucleoside-diphosphate-sugar epimerase